MYNAHAVYWITAAYFTRIRLLDVQHNQQTVAAYNQIVSTASVELLFQN